MTEQVRASEARHGGRFLTRHLNQRLAQPFMWAGLWYEAPELTKALANDSDHLTAAAAWVVIDGQVTPGAWWQTWSEHIGRLRTTGFDNSRAELLDEAITWPVIRFALGLAS